MYLEIVTPEASLVSGEVTSVTVPGVDGEFQMLNGHAPVVSLLGQGKVKFEGSPTIASGYENKFSQVDGKWILEIASGVIQMGDNKVIVLAD